MADNSISKSTLSKTKLCLLCVVSLSLVALTATFFINQTRAQETTSTTFPQDEAGIAAYVKLDNPENIDIDALADAFYSIESSAASYVIGSIKISNGISDIYPHLYVGLDGWLVAYFKKDEEASRLMQWQNYEKGTLNTTTLKDTIDHMTRQLGLIYSTPVKYYDFEFPEADKLTLVAEENANSFSATVPGAIYETSFNVVMRNACCSGFVCQSVILSIDGTPVYQNNGLGCWWTCASPFSSYGYYDSALFLPHASHDIELRGCGNPAQATILIYK